MTLFLCQYSAYGQDSIDSVQLSVRPYLGLRGHTAILDKQMELQENASRMGTELSIKKGKTTFFASVEVKVESN